LTDLGTREPQTTNSTTEWTAEPEIMVGSARKSLAKEENLRKERKTSIPGPRRYLLLKPRERKDGKRGWWVTVGHQNKTNKNRRTEEQVRRVEEINQGCWEKLNPLTMREEITKKIRRAFKECVQQ